jgi:IS5 family transposase
MNFLAEFDRLGRLSDMGDPLEKISGAVDFEQFRPILNKALNKQARGLGGRTPYDYVMMFKIVLLQQQYGIADDNTEYLINDRLSFQRFLGLSLTDKVPDAKTIWLFKENLKEKGVERKLFDMFRDKLESVGVITRKGSITDATFVDVPRQRNTRKENEAIKEGRIPEGWENGKAAELRQKDVDARWTKKNNETHYGYKDHVKADKDSKIIVEYSVTDASVHDSREIVGLTGEKDIEMYADSAYVGEELHKEIKEKSEGIVLLIHEKGYRNSPLTDAQKESNREKSRVRVRVEHIFGYMTMSMGGIFIRSVGIARATFAIGMKNPAYNLRRFAYLAGRKPSEVAVQGTGLPF